MTDAYRNRMSALDRRGAQVRQAENAWCSLCQVLSERLPILRFPAGVEVLTMAFRKPVVVKNELGFGSLFLQFKFDDRIDARRPVADVPRLNDAPARHHFNVAS